MHSSDLKYSEGLVGYIDRTIMHVKERYLGLEGGREGFYALHLFIFTSTQSSSIMCST